MAKHGHKRRKTDKQPANAAEPLGSRLTQPSLLDDVAKDDEERRLESILFGKAYISVSQNENILVVSDDEADEDIEVDGAKELQNMLDSDVCCMPSNCHDLIICLFPAILCR